MNIKNITSLVQTWINKKELSIKSTYIEYFETRNYIKPYEIKNELNISIFWGALLKILADLKDRGFKNDFLKKIVTSYYKDAICIESIELSELISIYNFPLCLPILYVLCWEKIFLIIDGEWEFIFKTEEELIIDISYWNDKGGSNLDWNILFNLQSILKKIWIDTGHPSKWTIQKLKKQIQSNMENLWWYEISYYTNPNQLWATIYDTASIPNRTTILKSNNKWAITHIKISTKIDLK